MKTIKNILITTALIAISGYSTSAQVYVKVKPGKPIKVKTVSPGKDYCYIDEDWTTKGDSYVWTGDRWEKVPKPEMVWTPGYWVDKKKGFVWVPGHWEERK
jgi:hypothetical protein